LSGRGTERAQLWAVYFGLLALADPPPFLARARDELKNHLEGGAPPPPVVTGPPRLWLVE
jgi:hypothetical protein